MNYKDLRGLDKLDIQDNGNGHFLMKCPWCKSMEMQVDARHDRGMCHNHNCVMKKRWLSISVIEGAVRRYL